MDRANVTHALVTAGPRLLSATVGNLLACPRDDGRNLPDADTSVSTTLYRRKLQMTQHKTLLIVDDEPSIRELLQGVLRRNGYRTLTAGSAEEALMLFKDC